MLLPYSTILVECPCQTVPCTLVMCRMQLPNCTTLILYEGWQKVKCHLIFLLQPLFFHPLSLFWYPVIIYYYYPITSEISGNNDECIYQDLQARLSKETLEKAYFIMYYKPSTYYWSRIEKKFQAAVCRGHWSDFSRDKFLEVVSALEWGQGLEVGRTTTE